MCQACVAAISTAAASLDPPPSPEPDGMRFTRSMSRPGVQSESGEAASPASTARLCAARTTRLLASVGTSWASADPAAVASLPPNRTRSLMPGTSDTCTRRVSWSVTGTISDSISWKPSARRARTASDRFSFAGARTDTGSDRRLD